MKKIIHISFISFFVIITLGFTVNKHYSGGKLFSLAIFSEPESCCVGECDCCDEKSETIQFRVDYTFSIDDFESAPTELELFAIKLLLSLDEPELVLAKNEFVEQDFPPPDQLTLLSYNQAFLL